MTNELPTSTPEQLDFADRLGMLIAPLLKWGMNLLDAERAGPWLAAEALLDEGADPEAVEALRAGALARADSGQRIKHTDALVRRTFKTG